MHVSITNMTIIKLLNNVSYPELHLLAIRYTCTT